MLKNRIIKVLVFFSFITILLSQSLNLLTQKFTLENAFQDKIYSVLGSRIDKSKFIVFVNVDLEPFSDIMSQVKDKQTSFIHDRNKIDPIPGLDVYNPNQRRSSRSSSSSTSSLKFGNTDEYSISRVDVSVFLAESIATGENEKVITAMIKDIVPYTKDCDDCITTEVMNFQASKEESEISLLRQELEALKENDRKREMSELNSQLAELRAQLEDSETDRMKWEEYQRGQDSQRLAKLEQIEEDEKNNLVTTLEKTQFKLDTVINARIESETQTKNDLIDIIKYNRNVPDEEANNLFGMQTPLPSSSNSLLFILIAILIVGLFSFILFNKKKQVVYLKPKQQSNPTNGNEQTVVQASVPQNTNPDPSASQMNEDDSVLLSELRAMRQSAVSLSASQKAGATQIIRDWLSDQSDEESSTTEE